MTVRAPRAPLLTRALRMDLGGGGAGHLGLVRPAPDYLLMRLWFHESHHLVEAELADRESLIEGAPLSLLNNVPLGFDSERYQLALVNLSAVRVSIRGCVVWSLRPEQP